MEYKNNLADYTAYIKEMGEKTNIGPNDIIDVKYLRPLYGIFKPEMKFLELGCGGGNVVRFANNIGYKSTGVEINRELTKDLVNVQIINCDIKLLSPYEYQTNDVIYIYSPFNEGFDEYVEMVVDSMKVGAYIMTPNVHQTKNKSLKRVAHFLYKKI